MIEPGILFFVNAFFFTADYTDTADLRHESNHQLPVATGLKIDAGFWSLYMRD